MTRSRRFSGAQVWHRGKRSAFLDIEDADDRGRAFVALATHADVLIESFAPGIDRAPRHRLRRPCSDANPRLIYCSITGYGDEGRHADRPAIDALVAARTGQQWESRGIDGGTHRPARRRRRRVSRSRDPAGAAGWAPPRPGPLFSGVPWVSMAVGVPGDARDQRRASGPRADRAAGSGWRPRCCKVCSATTAVRRGSASSIPTRRTSRVGSSTRRAPKGVFRCADGRWVHQWVPLPEFLLPPSRGRRARAYSRHEGTPRGRVVTDRHEAERHRVASALPALMAAAVAKFPSEEWIALAADVGIPLQPMRSPEEALHDPAVPRRRVRDRGRRSRASGRVRQVGRVYRAACLPDGAAAPRRATRCRHRDRARRSRRDSRRAAQPTASIREAGSPAPARRDPGRSTWGSRSPGRGARMMLADLGAEVIKVNASARRLLDAAPTSRCAATAASAASR